MSTIVDRWMAGTRRLEARSVAEVDAAGARRCAHCGSRLRDPGPRGWCGVCVGLLEISVKARRLRLGEHFPHLTYRTLRALTDARLEPDAVRLLSDERFLALPGLGRRALSDFRVWVPAPDEPHCNWVGEGAA